MLTRKRLLLTLSLLALIPLHGYSQFFYYYANPLAFGSQISRYTSGINIMNLNGEYHGLVPLLDASGFTIGDTIITRSVKGSGMGAAFGITLPIARTNKRSSFDVSIDLHYNTYTFKEINKGIGPENVSSSFFNVGTASTTTQLAVPLTLDLKWGSDAIAFRTTAIGGLLGIGGIPQFQSTVYSGFSSTSAVADGKSAFSILPCAKAELSVYAYLCFRVKVFYSLGNVSLFEGESKSLTTGQMVTSTFKTKNSLVISLCTLPFSFMWYKERHSHGWWNDFESDEMQWKRY